MSKKFKRRINKTDSIPQFTNHSVKITSDPITPTCVYCRSPKRIIVFTDGSYNVRRGASSIAWYAETFCCARTQFIGAGSASGENITNTCTLEAEAIRWAIACIPENILNSSEILVFSDSQNTVFLCNKTTKKKPTILTTNQNNSNPGTSTSVAQTTAQAYIARSTTAAAKTKQINPSVKNKTKTQFLRNYKVTQINHSFLSTGNPRANINVSFDGHNQFEELSVNKIVAANISNLISAGSSSIVFNNSCVTANQTSTFKLNSQDAKNTFNTVAFPVKQHLSSKQQQQQSSVCSDSWQQPISSVVEAASATYNKVTHHLNADHDLPLYFEKTPQLLSDYSDLGVFLRENGVSFVGYVAGHSSLFWNELVDEMSYSVTHGFIVPKNIVARMQKMHEETYLSRVLSSGEYSTRGISRNNSRTQQFINTYSSL